MRLDRYCSPLRYPGGKGKIANYIKLLIEHNLLSDGIYVEPYAGGSAVALDLLFNEYVSDIYINDIDTSIYAFWHATLFDCEELCRKISRTRVSIAEWQRQKHIKDNNTKHSVLDVAFSTFFLNRTNRSGIISGGVIGGIDQTGAWKIDARYNKKALIARIERIAEYADRIHLYNDDAVQLVTQLNKELPKNTLFYLDPPYFNKGHKLYMNYYKLDDHKDIARSIKALKGRYWLVSYDNVEQIKDLYNNFRQHEYTLNYSAASAAQGSEVLIFSKNLIVPDINNPTDRSEISNYLKENYG